MAAYYYCSCNQSGHCLESPFYGNYFGIGGRSHIPLAYNPLVKKVFFIIVEKKRWSAYFHKSFLVEKE